MKFILENSEEYNLEQLIGCGSDHVINSWLDNYDDVLQVLSSGAWRTLTKAGCNLDRKLVYRVLAKPYTLEDAISDMNTHFEEGRINTNLAHVPIEILERLAASLGDKS